MKQFFLFLTLLFFGLSFDRLNIFKYCILSSILHELGHIITYSLCIKKYPEIKVSIFGFKMSSHTINNRYYPLILLSGPLINFLIAFSSFIYLQYVFRLNVYILMIVNIFIFIINILPVYYLDGGQLIYLFSRFYQRNYQVISALSLIILSVMYLYFTHNFLPVILFFFYFIINLINDV